MGLPAELFGEGGPARWRKVSDAVAGFLRADGKLAPIYAGAKDFYVNKLGFSVIRENYRPERKDWKLDLRVNDNTELEIFAEENPPMRVNRPEACGLRHLAFCMDKLTYAGNLSTLAPVMDNPNFRFVKADICDREAVDKLFEEEHPDIVVNFAAESHVDRSIEDPGIFLQTDIIDTSVLMDACRKHGKALRRCVRHQRCRLTASGYHHIWQSLPGYVHCR